MGKKGDRDTSRGWLSHFRSMIMVTRIRVGEVGSKWMPMSFTAVGELV